MSKVNEKDVQDVKESDQVEHIDLPELESAKPKYKANTQLDDAARILAEAGHQEFSKEDKKRVLRWIDFYVCLPMGIVYCVQQLDKSSLGYAAVFDLREATNLHGTEYSWLTSVVYLAQLFTQPLSAYALVVFPVKWWVIFNFCGWTIATLCTASAHNFVGLLVARLFLGIFEATILPSFILITQMWWTRREQAYRTTAYQVANSVAPIIGPMLTWAVGHAPGKMHSYQKIFLCIGGVSAAFIPIVAWMMPNSPTTARFLNKGNDRLIALDRIRENNTGTKSSTWKWSQVRETFCDPKTYLWALMFFLMSVPPGGLGAFGALIIKGLGFSSFASILMQMPTGVIGIFSMVFWTWLVNKIKLRYPIVALNCLFPIAGAGVLALVDKSKIPALIVGFYLIFVGTRTPLTSVPQLMYSWANLNASGSTKRVVTTACMFVAMCLGNIVGPQIYLAKEAPHYRSGLYGAMACWALLCLVALGMGMYLKLLNRRQERRRVSLGLPGKLEDMSIMSLDDADAYKVKLMDTLREQGHDAEALYANSFDDMTDFENPMFMYVL